MTQWKRLLHPREGNEGKQVEGHLGSREGSVPEEDRNNSVLMGMTPPRRAVTEESRVDCWDS